MTQNRFYSSVAFPTFLTTGVGASGNPQVASVTGEPGSYPYTMLIDWGLSTQEAISVTGSPTGSGPFTLPCTRGIDGTTAQSHGQNAVVVQGVTAQDYNEPQVHISLGTSGTGINQVHDLANGSSVVGTTDTQTLTNKTFTGATVSGGDLTITNSDASNPIVTITNTHTTPSGSILRIIATTAGDTSFGIRVSGDTVNRLHIDSNGKMQWGPGGSGALDTDFYRNSTGVLKTDTALTVGTVLTTATEAISSSQTAGALLTITNTHSAPSAPNMQHIANAAADSVTGIEVTGDSNFRYTIDSNGKQAWGSGSGVSDTNLYRNAAGELKTDQSITAALNVTVGGDQVLAGGSGVIGINNAGTTPTTTPSNAAILYSKSAGLKWRGGDGADYQTGSNISFVGAAGVNVTGSGANTITGLTAGLGVGTYLISLNLSYLPTGSIGSTTTFNFAFTGTASTTALNWQILQQGVSNAVTMAGGSLSTITGSMLSPTHVATGAGLSIYGIAIVSVAGTLTLTATDQVSGDTITVNGGSYMEIQPIL